MGARAGWCRHGLPCASYSACLASLQPSPPTALQVEDVEVLRATCFDEHSVYLEARGMIVDDHNLRDELGQHKTLLVPVIHLRATDAARDGPQAAGVCCMHSKGSANCKADERVSAALHAALFCMMYCCCAVLYAVLLPCCIAAMRPGCCTAAMPSVCHTASCTLHSHVVCCLPPPLLGAHPPIHRSRPTPDQGGDQRDEVARPQAKLQ